MTHKIELYIQGDPQQFKSYFGFRKAPRQLIEDIERFKAGEHRTIKPRNLPSRISPEFNILPWHAVVYASFDAAGDSRADERLGKSKISLEDTLKLLALVRRATDEEGRLTGNPVPLARLVQYKNILSDILARTLTDTGVVNLSGTPEEWITGPIYDFVVTQDITRLLRPYAMKGVVQQLRPDKLHFGENA